MINFLGQPYNFADKKQTNKILYEKTKIRKIIQPTQTHSNNVVEITKNNFKNEIFADGVWTREKNIMLSIKTADCLSVIFNNKNENIIANIHAGWKGLASKIISNFLINFNEKINKNFKVFISPCLHVCCSEFTNPYQETPNYFHKHIIKKNEKYYVDLIKVCIDELISNNIKLDNIHNENICTKCGTGFWSHRNKNTERNISYIIQ
jgi:YfiH family protein